MILDQNVRRKETATISVTGMEDVTAIISWVVASPSSLHQVPISFSLHREPKRHFRAVFRMWDSRYGYP